MEVVKVNILQALREFFGTLLPQMEFFNDSLAVRQLVAAYLDGKVVGSASRNDASHVAYTTVHGCAGLVSWNFKHIVNEDKSLSFNLVNMEQGYPQVFIASPKEVLSHVQER